MNSLQLLIELNMNRENVIKAINIMKRAKNICMLTWQQSPDRKSSEVYTEEELHACGNKACFAGYIAISPEFKADGGACSRLGAPLYNGYNGSDAIAAWLEIPQKLAESFVHGDCVPLYPDSSYDVLEADELHSSFYEKKFSDVTSTDVISKLEKLLQ